MNLDTLAVHWKRVTIIGVGLLGGSLGISLSQKKLAREVVGYVRNSARARQCEQRGAVTKATCDLRESVAASDLIVLCTPLAQMKSLVAGMLPSLARGAVVTDVGSVKVSVLRELEALISKAGAHFVGSHPMAGAEKTGVAAARADLFKGAVCVITPTPRTNRRALLQVEKLWRALGARCLRLPATLHDQLVSRSSHLPHVVAAALANRVLDPAQPPHQAALCANGFRDTTRIASGSPEMWRDIALANRQNLARALGSFARDLVKLQGLLRRSDARAISKFLERAKDRRDRWAQTAAANSPE